VEIYGVTEGNEVDKSRIWSSVLIQRSERDRMDLSSIPSSYFIIIMSEQP
jgi:hypothetical protein